MLIFVGLLWLNQALAKVDIVVENGQPARIFLELAGYLLPRVLEVAIPISGFAAAVFITNRLFSESELVVMMTAGRSNLMLAKPALMFGLFTWVLLSITTIWLMPWAEGRLGKRQDEIARQYVTQIVKPGEFISALGRYTFFFGEKGVNGDLTDVMINEQFSDNLTITHIAQSGQAVSDDGVTKLLLFNGTVQEHYKDTNTLSVVQFSTMALDLKQFASNLAEHVPRPLEFSTTELIEKLQTVEQGSDEHHKLLAAYHSRFAKPLLSLFAPVLGMIMLLVGGFSRAGFLPRIVVAIALMFSFDAFRGISETWVAQGTTPAIGAYAPVLGIVLVIAIALRLASADLSKLGSLFVLRRARVTN